MIEELKAMRALGFGEKIKIWSIALGAVLIGIIGYFDLATGRNLSFVIFYVMAICYITWSVGKLPGVVASFASAMICFFDEYTGEEFIRGSIIPFFNACGIFGVFLIIVFLLSEVRGFLMKREADNRNKSDLE